MVKKLMTIMFLSLTAQVAQAQWVKWDLSPEVNPVFIRELHDGNWLAGYSKPNIVRHEFSNPIVKDIHAGIFHAWRVNQGDAAVGLNLGLGLGDLGAALGAIGDSLNLPNTAKWTSILASSVSLDLYGGYRPVHGPDVHAWAYGVGAYLQKRFGLPDLVKGY